MIAPTSIMKKKVCFAFPEEQTDHEETQDVETACILERMRVFYSRFNSSKADEVNNSNQGNVDQLENE